MRLSRHALKANRGSARTASVFRPCPGARRYVPSYDERDAVGDAVSAGIRDWRLPESGIRRFFVHFFPEKAPFIETPRIWGF